MSTPTAGSVRWLTPNARLALAAIATGVIYNLDGWLVPGLEQGIVERFHLTTVATGVIPTAENVTAGVLSIALSRWAKWTSLGRPTLLALALWLLGNIVTPLAPSAQVLIGLRIMAGIGSGMLVYISSTLASATLGPDRTYSLLTGASNAFAAVVIATLPLILPGAGNLTIFPYAAVVSCAWIPLALLLPATIQARSISTRTATDAAGSAGGSTTILAIMLVIAVTAFGLYVMSNFSYIIPLAARAGMQQRDIQLTIGSVAFMGTVGALAVFALPRRMGHGGPILLALLASCASNYLSTTTESSEVLRISMMASQLLAFFMVPLFLGWSAAFDPSGRTATVINGALMVSGSMSPLVGGYLIQEWSLYALAVQTIAASVIAVACVVAVWVALRYRARTVVTTA
jgi:predicted MFS family arabinose efflux permease